MNKRGRATLIIFIIILVIAAVAVYFTFFFAYTCKDSACFRSHQEKCSKTKFVSETDEASWYYFIKGKTSEGCKINVKVLKVKQGTLDKTRLVGLSMDCYLPVGEINSPEADIAKCHGELKEELQNMIIQKLHSYILTNIGQINTELEGIGNVASVVNEVAVTPPTNSSANNTTNSSG